MLGRLADARRLGTRAVESESGRTDFLPDALQLLGDVATDAAAFDGERGERHYRRALAMAEGRGMRPLVAHCHLGLGRLHGRMGRGGPAREHLHTAAPLYGEMEMRCWLAKAEAESSA